MREQPTQQRYRKQKEQPQRMRLRPQPLADDPPSLGERERPLVVGERLPRPVERPSPLGEVVLRRVEPVDPRQIEDDDLPVASKVAPGAGLTGGGSGFRSGRAFVSVSVAISRTPLW